MSASGEAVRGVEGEFGGLNPDDGDGVDEFRARAFRFSALAWTRARI